RHHAQPRHDTVNKQVHSHADLPAPNLLQQPLVALDPRWLLRAVGAHYRDLLDQGKDSNAFEDGEEGLVEADGEDLWHSTPAQYLEKIFQVVLTLPPLDTSGYQQMLHTPVGVRDDLPAPTVDSQPAASHQEDAWVRRLRSAPRLPRLRAEPSGQ
ncbi:hypothetical protein, partial [Streptomyces nojiriensis]|uniref:hypothetical protein n=1 Tax=Streptomyces nojiriensis TaxID=66374 RepID=UPI0035D7E38A